MRRVGTSAQPASGAIWPFGGRHRVITVFPELPGWRFSAKEISPGVYEVLGVDQRGHQRVLSKGTDASVVLDECRNAAVRARRERGEVHE
jgi:hypothetical protein